MSYKNGIESQRDSTTACHCFSGFKDLKEEANRAYVNDRNVLVLPTVSRRAYAMTACQMSSRS